MSRLSYGIVLACALVAGASAVRVQRSLISDVGATAFTSVNIPCNIAVIGTSCYDVSIPPANVADYPWGNAAISYPTTGAPWGRHMVGPATDGTTYTFSWLAGDSTVGTAPFPTPNIANQRARIIMSTTRGNTIAGSRSATQCPSPCVITSTARWTAATVITYSRVHLPTSGAANASYLSPFISHVELKLAPATRYFYTVEFNGAVSTEETFVTLPAIRVKTSTVPTPAAPAQTYPLRLAAVGNFGQTNNATLTASRIAALAPNQLLYTGDFGYADLYGANNPDLRSTVGASQKRWDSYEFLFERLLKNLTMVYTVGNREIEPAGIPATINLTTLGNTFAFPTNYPFQGVSARYQFPGSAAAPAIDGHYYTTRSGPITYIVLNQYIPFHAGTPQHTWATSTFRAVDRAVTPWLIVLIHAPPYHTYVGHYKEVECFMAIYEDMFFNARVDFVLSGHTLGYERTHPVYKYAPNTCGPIYLTLGTGGTVEPIYRNFVDEVQPSSGLTYCETMRVNGLTVAQMLAGGNQTLWGPGYQRQVNPPGCNPLTFQAASIPGTTPLVLNPANPTQGFCQPRQPAWSARRDPSLGFATLTLTSDTQATIRFHRNVDAPTVVSDEQRVERQASCAV